MGVGPTALSRETYSSANFGVRGVLLDQIVVEVAELLGVTVVEGRLDGAQLLRIHKEIILVLLLEGCKFLAVVDRLYRLLTGEELSEAHPGWLRELRWKLS